MLPVVRMSRKLHGVLDFWLIHVVQVPADIEGQALQSDLKSGRQEDHLAFRFSFVSNESLYFRVARPNELKGWVERLEKVRERGME